MISKFPYTGLGQNVSMTIVVRSNSLSEFGEPVVVCTWTGKGDYFEGASESVTETNPASSSTLHTSYILINGDPLAVVSEGYVNGTVTVNGFEHDLFTMKRRRNPDGTVHHLYLGVK